MTTQGPEALKYTTTPAPNPPSDHYLASLRLLLTGLNFDLLFYHTTRKLTNRCDQATCICLLPAIIQKYITK